MIRKYVVTDERGNVVWEWDIEFDDDDDDDIEEAAERIGADELGTRVIISGGEALEIREGVSSQQWFENIKPITY